jgi:hypothetical protein
MSIDSLSSINCEIRNGYDKNFCEGLNPDNIDDFLKPYKLHPFGFLNNNDSFFDKNNFILSDEKENLKNLPKEKCASHCIDNNYSGFTYTGDKNKCMIFNNNNFNTKINEELKKNYNIKTFLKTKDSIDIKNIENVNDFSNYFTQTDNQNMMPNSIIGKVNVNNQKECIDSCVLNYPNCKSVMYLEQPKNCTFYNNKKMNENNQINDKNDFDIYSVKTNKVKKQKEIINDLLLNNDNSDNNYYYCNSNNNQCFLEHPISKKDYESKMEFKEKNKFKVPVYNCSGINSVNPFCTKEYDELDYKNGTQLVNYTDCVEITTANEQQNIFNEACKKKYGDEYVFDNDSNNNEYVLKCGNGTKKAKCKINFDNKVLDSKKILNNHIEHFTNINNEKSSHKFVIWVILFFLFLCMFAFFYSKKK